jgi:hypothetical protein
VSAIDTTRNIERISLQILRPFLQQRAFNGQYVVTSKGPLARELQRSVGDMLYNKDAETIYSVEVKAEQENEHENFFIETWSNRARFTTGWVYNLNADFLFYHFLKDDELYIIPFQKLRRWAFHDRRIYGFPERKQSKYDQLNDTWGRCVPIGVATRELSLAPPYSPEREGAARIEAAE